MSSNHYFSYFEFYDIERDVYVSLFPTTKTTFEAAKMPKEKDKVFTAINKEKLLQELIALQRNNLGFSDTFWFVFKQAGHTLYEINLWMNSLEYEPTDEITPAYGVCYLRSSLDPTFRVKVYVKSDPLPQEAIDVIPVFQSQKDGETYLVLGKKKKSPTISVRYNDEETRQLLSVDLLSVGLYGTVIFGEHLEESEKKRMDELQNSFRNKPIQMNKKQVSPVLRTLLEESGFNLSSSECECYYVHYDNRLKRDPRYTTYKINEFDRKMFGYTRDSASHTVLVLMKGEVPDVLPDPDDYAECDRPIVIDTKKLRSLLYAGYLNFAFRAHIAQLFIALNSEILLSPSERLLQISFHGLTLTELREKYTRGNVCVSMIEDYSYSLERNNDYNPDRMNVSLSSNGKVSRVLGFY